MNDIDFTETIIRYQDGSLSADETMAMEKAMHADPAKRQLFAQSQLRSMALHDRFRQEAFKGDTDTPVYDSAQTGKNARFAWITRPIASMAAGLLIGLFSASIVWAVSSPKATTERLFSLINGGFDDEHIASGFPTQTGLWSGDEAVVNDGRLRFIATGGDSNDPKARAISCDVFQLVDLRPLREMLSLNGDSVLELSAEFIDVRPHNTKPSVTFFCQLYLFRGDPNALHQSWPQSLTDSLSSGSAQVTTLGADAKGTRTLTAKALIPVEADFAVIQIAARPNLRPTKLDALFVDDVKLTLKTQPSLPIRIVQR
jgi:hypothetical protein